MTGRQMLSRRLFAIATVLFTAGAVWCSGFAVWSIGRGGSVHFAASAVQAAGMALVALGLWRNAVTTRPR